MRESNFTFPHQNRAVVSITHMLYDRRALDTSSNIALLNNLTSLTYLTSTSPRIREILTWDGGLERLMDILRESTLPRPGHIAADWWGLNGPSTARIIGIDREVSLRHSLAFQCLVNIGVRGSEAIRTRVVQAGALDLVAQILESWLQQYRIGIVPAPYGSQAAIDAHRMGRSTSAEPRRRARSIGSRGLGNGTLPPSARASLSQFIAAFNPRSIGSTFLMSEDADTGRPDDASSRTGDTDVDMADGEGEGEEGTEVEDERSIGGMEDSMEVDEPERAQSAPPEDTAVDQAAVATTPRASVAGLPQPMAIPTRALRETTSVASSVNDSYADVNDAGLPRIASDNNLAGTARMPMAAGPSRLGHLVPNDALSVPVAGTSAQPPLRPESAQGQTRRRDTITARPTNLNNLAPRNDRERGDNSETSDGGGDHEERTRTIVANVNLGAIQGRQPFFAGPPDAQAEAGIDVATIPETGQPEEPDADAIAAEQARLDMEAGAPPGQPGAAQTPRIEAAQNPDPMAAAGAAALMTAVPPGLDVNNGAPTQIIIANGAPRGFTDLGAYFGVSSHLNPDANQYSEDSILLALQLLAYLSKYPHVRSAFHHPRRPMHPTFELNPEITKQPLPEREPASQTSNIFSLVERFTFRPSPSDPRMHPIPSEVQYWAGVIMRNACRKDEARGGIRQCAHMSCGKWESVPREFAKCRRCRKAKYCSKECQSRAWQEGHRFWCNPRTDLELGQQADAQAGGGSGGPGGGGGGRPGPGGGDDDDDDVARPPRPTQGGAVPMAALPAANHHSASGPGPGIARTPAQMTALATLRPTFQQAAQHHDQRNHQQRGEPAPAPAPTMAAGANAGTLQPGAPFQDGVVGLLPRPPPFAPVNHAQPSPTPAPAPPRQAGAGGVVLPPSILNATIWGFDQREVGTLAAATTAARPPVGGARHRNPIGNFDLPFR